MFSETYILDLAIALIHTTYTYMCISYPQSRLKHGGCGKALVIPHSLLLGYVIASKTIFGAKRCFSEARRHAEFHMHE